MRKHTCLESFVNYVFEGSNKGDDIKNSMYYFIDITFHFSYPFLEEKEAENKKRKDNNIDKIIHTQFVSALFIKMRNFYVLCLI